MRLPLRAAAVRPSGREQGLNLQLRTSEPVVHVLKLADASPTSLTELRKRRQLALQRMRDNLHELRARNGRMVSLVGAIRKELAASSTNRLVFEVRFAPPAAPVVSGQAIRKLATREIAVLRLVAGGLSNKEIAIELGISQKTVRNHMSAVFSKLGVSNRTGAVLYAMRSGFFSV